jgi:hypothetical protein
MARAFAGISRAAALRMGAGLMRAGQTGGTASAALLDRNPLHVGLPCGEAAGRVGLGIRHGPVWRQAATTDSFDYLQVSSDGLGCPPHSNTVHYMTGGKRFTSTSCPGPWRPDLPLMQALDCRSAALNSSSYMETAGAYWLESRDGRMAERPVFVRRAIAKSRLDGSQPAASDRCMVMGITGSVAQGDLE